MKVFEFTTELKKMDDMDATLIEFPYNTKECFGKKGQVKVYVDVNGYEYRSSLAKMGHHCSFVVFRKEHREKTGLKPGESILVKIREDKDVRTVEVPEDIQEALDVYPEISEFFHNMSFTHRREYVEWISSAKKEETRLRRIEKGISTLIKMYDEKNLKKKNKK